MLRSFHFEHQRFTCGWADRYCTHERDCWMYIRTPLFMYLHSHHTPTQEGTLLIRNHTCWRIGPYWLLSIERCSMPFTGDHITNRYSFFAFGRRIR